MSSHKDESFKSYQDAYAKALTQPTDETIAELHHNDIAAIRFKQAGNPMLANKHRRRAKGMRDGLKVRIDVQPYTMSINDGGSKQ